MSTIVEQYQRGDRVELLGHDREGVVLAATSHDQNGTLTNDRVTTLHVAALNRNGDRVVYHLSPEEVEKRRG